VLGYYYATGRQKGYGSVQGGGRRVFRYVVAESLPGYWDLRRPGWAPGRGAGFGSGKWLKFAERAFLEERTGEVV
jgi:hypothetical protein